MGGSHVLSFTQVLSSLLSCGMTVPLALDAMCAMPSLAPPVSRAAREVRLSMLGGMPFCRAVEQCASVRFSGEYCGLLCAVEEGGATARALAFLATQEARRREAARKVHGALLYPAFVAALALGLSVAFVVYAPSLAVSLSGQFDQAAFRAAAVRGFAKAAAFLLLAGVAFLVAVRRLLSPAREMGAFVTLSFLCGEQVPIAQAVALACAACHEGRVTARLLEAARSLERGQGFGVALGALGAEYAVHFELAQRTGNIAAAFSAVVRMLEEKQSRGERACLSLVEPCMIVVAALYLCILLKDIAMPLLFSYGIAW